MSKTVIGWKETVDLLDWGVRHLVAKIDTGARRSSIDATRIRESEGGFVEFDLMLHRRKRSLRQRVRAPVSHTAKVKSSNGQVGLRYFVLARTRIGGMVKEIDVSLVDRDGMTCRMLIGRRSLEDDFLVDSGSRYLSRARKKLAVQPGKTNAS